jgi:hypothetical protein
MSELVDDGMLDTPRCPDCGKPNCECDYDGDCAVCGGDGWVRGYEEDPIFYAPDELIRCASCNGSGRAKDMTIW